MSQKEQCYFSGEEKVRILRQHLLDGKPVSEVSEQHGINPGVFYQWQKAFFGNGAKAFEGGPGRRATAVEKRVQDLEQRLQRKHEAISELMEEHIRLSRNDFLEGKRLRSRCWCKPRSERGVAQGRYNERSTKELRVLQEHVAEFEAAIAQAFAAHPEHSLFRELPGAGPTLVSVRRAPWCTGWPGPW